MTKMLRETWNVIQLGIGMCLVFFAFTAQGFIVETVLSDRHDEDPRISKNAGYYSQTIIYGTFIISNIIAPPIIKLLTPKWSLVFGSSAYTVYMIGYQFLNPYFLYASAAYEGLCAGALWTAMGEYLALNSTDKTIGRNSGLVWIIYTSSFIFGGLFLLIMFGSSSDEYISKGQMRVLFGCFALVCFLGNCVFALLEQTHKSSGEEKFQLKDYAMELKKSWDLLWTVDLLLLVPLFGFSGMELSFYSSVYSTALSFTKQFTINTNKLMALNSIAVGIGELAGGIPFLLLGRRLTLRHYGNTMIVLLGVCVALAAYTIALINLPGRSSFEDTYDTSLLSHPSVALALIGGGLLGFTDACVNTAIYSFVTVRYHDRTVQAFALHKFVHAALSTVCMFYGSVLQLQWQILILLIGGAISAATFAMAEMRWNRVDGAWHCQSESRLHVLLKEFDIGHRYHFPLVLAKSLVVLSCLFLSTHLHNDVSKQFLLTACAPVAAEIALNVVVLVLFLVDYFPNLDTVTTFLRFQKTFEVVVGDVYILASCVYLIFNFVQMKTGRSLKKTTHILIFQALFLISSIFGVLTLIDHKLHDFSTLFLVYHCSLTVLCGVVFVTSGFYLLTITAQSDGRTRLREGLIIFPFLSIALSIFLAISPYFEDLCRLILKLSPIAILPVTVLFLPSFRRLFYCWERVPPIQDKKNTSLVRPVTPGWTNNQYRIEKMANGVYRVDVSR